MKLLSVCIKALFRDVALNLYAGSFYRAAIPQDITSGLPNPDNWGEPVAALASTSCNISQFFVNHSIIFGEIFS